ncbi:MAG: TolC family protein, partial [Anaerolineae bacterium]|nr:TolC family protein [Phycisphaerae bacterium]
MDNRYLAGAAIVSVAAFALAGCVGPPPRINVENDAAGAARLQSEIVFSEVGHQIDEGSGPPDVLTIDDAIRRSVLGSPQVQSSIARVRQAQATSRQARLLPNPVLSIAVRFPEHGGKPTVDAGLTADLIAVLSRPGQSRAADNRLRAAAADAVTTVLDVMSEVQERYVAVQTNEALLVVLHDRAGIVERLLGISRSRLEL